MEIPYTVEIRRDTGLTNGKIGIWLFLASEVMLFGALFASYILIRTGAPSWPRGDTILNVPLATFNTIVLITSSITMVMAWASLMRNRFSTYRMYMAGTILLGFEATEPLALVRGTPKDQLSSSGGTVRPITEKDLPACAELCRAAHIFYITR